MKEETKYKLSSTFNYTLLIIWMALLFIDLFRDKSLLVVIDVVFIFMIVWDLVDKTEE